METSDLIYKKYKQKGIMEDLGLDVLTITETKQIYRNMRNYKEAS